VSTATWPQGHLKGSAGAAIRLILRLLDPTQHGGWRRPSALPRRLASAVCISLTRARLLTLPPLAAAKTFAEALRRADRRHVLSMSLGKHVNGKGGERCVPAAR
jgi:hypothetical protein